MSQPNSSVIHIRATTPNDAHYFLDIDIKCFDYAWTPEEWRAIGRTSIGAVATWYGTPIGMCIFRRTEEGDVEVLKLAVKKNFRRKGIGRRLLWNCVLYGRQISAGRVFIVVPESMVDPGQPGDISGWLSKFDFKAGKPLLRDAFCFYGKPEDGIVFSCSCYGNHGETK